MVFKTARRALLITVIGGTFFAIAAASAESTSKELTERLIELMEQGDEAGATELLERSADRNMKASIELEGRIEDGSGKPLAGVGMTVTQTRLAINPANAASKSKEITVDGEFALACDDCSAIEVQFHKPGYYSIRREWITFRPGAKPEDIIDHAVVVILQAKGIRAQLERYSGTLETGVRSHVLPFSFGRGRGMMTPERVVEIAQAEKIAQPLYLELTVERTADGSIAVEEVARPGSNVIIKRPRNPMLDFGNANGGAIVFKPTEQNIQLVEREMSRAPTSGYLPTLDLTRLDGLPEYFYCRIGDRYGRGSVSPVGLSRSEGKPNRSQVAVSIDLNIVAGDTNLTPH